VCGSRGRREERCDLAFGMMFIMLELCRYNNRE
jgi:hypothetical protein